MTKFIKVTQVDTEQKIMINIDKIVGVTETEIYMGTDDHAIVAVIHFCSAFREGITTNESIKSVLKKIRKARK